MTDSAKLRPRIPNPRIMPPVMDRGAFALDRVGAATSFSVTVHCTLVLDCGLGPGPTKSMKDFAPVSEGMTRVEANAPLPSVVTDPRDVVLESALRYVKVTVLVGFQFLPETFTVWPTYTCIGLTEQLGLRGGYCFLAWAMGAARKTSTRVMMARVARRALLVTLLTSGGQANAGSGS
jgi:hypothetical protein